MRGCDRRTVDTLCRDHLTRLDRRWVPVVMDGATNEARCGLCETPVWLLWQNDAPRDRQWIIEANGSIEGRLRIEEGGFTVLSIEQARQHRSWRDAPPLYRAHPIACRKVKMLIDAGHVTWAGASGE